MKWFVYIFLVLMGVTGIAQGGLYRWVDSNGKVHYSDHVPPEHASQEKKRLDSTGRTVETIERSKTEQELEELRKLKAEREEQKRIEAKRRAKDRVLLLTYQSIDEIISARDTKIATVETSIQHAMDNRKAQTDRLRVARKNAADFERASKPIPKPVLVKIKGLQQQIAKTNGYIDKKRKEQQEIRSEFADYIDRYKSLTE